MYAHLSFEDLAVIPLPFTNSSILTGAYVVPDDRTLILRAITASIPSGQTSKFTVRTLHGNLPEDVFETSIDPTAKTEHLSYQILPPGTKIAHTGYTHKVKAHGHWVFNERRLPESKIEEKVEQFTLALKQSQVDALKSASIEVLVKKVAEEIASGTNESLAKRLSDLIEEKVKDAVENL